MPPPPVTAGCLAPESFGAIVEAMDEPLMVIALHGPEAGTIQYANAAAAALYGYWEQGLVGVRASSLVHSSQTEQTARRVQDLMAGRWRRAYATHLRADGTLVAVESASGIVQLGDMPCVVTLSRAVGTAGDPASESPRADAPAPVRTPDDLTRATKRFVGMLSHELRNPISGILGLLDLGTDAVANADPTAALHLLGTARERATALLSLVDDMLEVCRPEQRPSDLIFAPTDVAALVAAVAAERASMAWAAEVHVAIEIDEQARTWSLDPLRCRKAVRALLDNAIKFNHPEGHVWIRVCQTDGGLQISVEDEGVGLPRGAEAEVLEPFTQGDSSPTRRWGGTGMGLALVDRIAREIGATFTLRPRSPRGTEASLWLLPTQAPRAPTSGSPTSTAAPRTPHAALSSPAPSPPAPPSPVPPRDPAREAAQRAPRLPPAPACAGAAEPRLSTPPTRSSTHRIELHPEAPPPWHLLHDLAAAHAQAAFVARFEASLPRGLRLPPVTVIPETDDTRTLRSFAAWIDESAPGASAVEILASHDVSARFCGEALEGVRWREVFHADLAAAVHERPGALVFMSPCDALDSFVEVLVELARGPSHAPVGVALLLPSAWTLDDLVVLEAAVRRLPTAPFLPGAAQTQQARS